MKRITLLLIATTILFVSCADKIPLSEENKDYAGRWEANDGTWIQIYNDGGASMETSNTSVDGGALTLTDSTLQIELFGIGSTFGIDKPPYEENGVWTMVLDGNDYVKR